MSDFYLNNDKDFTEPASLVYKADEVLDTLQKAINEGAELDLEVISNPALSVIEVEVTPRFKLKKKGKRRVWVKNGAESIDINAIPSNFVYTIPPNKLVCHPEVAAKISNILKSSGNIEPQV